jgi:integrase
MSLSAAFVRSAEPELSPVSAIGPVRPRPIPKLHADGRGLYLRVSETGTKSWVLKYTLHGKTKEMGLGPAGDRDVTLAEARELADRWRKVAREGRDPVLEREKEKVAAASVMTFENCAQQYIAAHQPEWRNAKHREQWATTMKDYVYPKIGRLPAHEVTATHVLAVLKPLWEEKPETASRLRGRIEAILSTAAVLRRNGGFPDPWKINPAAWDENLVHLLPKLSSVRKRGHHAALPYAELPAFMAELRQKEGVAALALEFAIVTAARTGEVLGATWSEINLADKIWTIPAERMKAGEEHVVPLSPRAVEILHAMQGQSDTYVFAGRDGALSSAAMLMTLKSLRPEATTHGFRSSFYDWVADATGFSENLADLALAHKVSDEVKAAYRRGKGFEKRRQLMAAWDRYCASPATPAGAVVPMHRVVS